MAAMPKRMRGVYLQCLVALAAAGCGSSTPPTAATPIALTGSVSDAAGDAVDAAVLRNGASVVPVVPIRPDLTAATVTVSGGTLTATISFAPGTMSQTDIFACLMLDVDENRATGSSQGSEPTVGWDYSVCAVLPRGSTTAQVSNLSGATAVAVGSVPVTFPAADQLRFSAALSMLGNDDGRMAFAVHAMAWVDDPAVLNSGVIDYMPDLGRAAGLVR